MYILGYGSINGLEEMTEIFNDRHCQSIGNSVASMGRPVAVRSRRMFDERQMRVHADPPMSFKTNCYKLSAMLLRQKVPLDVGLFKVMGFLLSGQNWQRPSLNRSP